ncbi:MAG TPA: NADH-quinone oxidoreductase subunit J, partial [Roseiflexaceae bacterium]|nr:NADH-quinone oxidoreductase subunit J [Roseiflexaceae bacterium]
MILVAALMTVTAHNLVHAALWLVTAFFSIGALYMLMQAEFV